MSSETEKTNSTGNTPRAFAAGVTCYFWLMVGFVLGTLVLLYPVRWLTDALHRAGASELAEKLSVGALVLAYVIASFILARRLSRFVRNCGTRRVGWGLAAVVTLFAASTAWAWHDPRLVLASAAGGDVVTPVATKRGATFEFGAYPDRERLEQLRARGVTTIISLQVPRIPVEYEGVHEEQELARELGLKLISAPMVPWFGDNTASLDLIRRVATDSAGHFYVHCGLGRDRVNMAKRVIEGVGAKAIATADLHQALGFEGRVNDFDKGSLISLAPGVWLTPYPEKEELYGCFLEGRPGRVVLLLDAHSPPQDSLLRQARQLLGAYSVPFDELPLTPGDTTRARLVADSLHHLTPPVTIIAYRTPWHNGRQTGDEPAVSLSDAFALHHWRIATGYSTVTHKENEWTGGKEKGC